MHAAAVRRAIALHHKEAGLKDWLKWFAQPFKVIWKHHKEFVQGPVDDAIDAIIKDLAPRLVRAIGEKEVQEDISDFKDGALRGKFDAEKGYSSPPQAASQPISAPATNGALSIPASFARIFRQRLGARSSRKPSRSTARPSPKKSSTGRFVRAGRPSIRSTPSTPL